MSGPMFLYPESCRQPSRHLATYHRSTDASTRPTGAPESRRLSRGGDQGSKLRPPSTGPLHRETAWLGAGLMAD
jgi:hypothetical protein